MNFQVKDSKSFRADSGSYSCVAKNFAGEAEAGFTVTVLTPPHIEEQIDQNPRIVEGNDVILHCPVQGNPKPKVILTIEKQNFFRDRVACWLALMWKGLPDRSFVLELSSSHTCIRLLFCVAKNFVVSKG